MVIYYYNFEIYLKIQELAIDRLKHFKGGNRPSSPPPTIYAYAYYFYINLKYCIFVKSIYLNVKNLVPYYFIPSSLYNY